MTKLQNISSKYTMVLVCIQVWFTWANSLQKKKFALKQQPHLNVAAHLYDVPAARYIVEIEVFTTHK